MKSADKAFTLVDPIIIDPLPPFYIPLAIIGGIYRLVKKVKK